MYNVRRKLWILTVLLFAVSAVMLKFFPSSDNNDAIATPASAQQAESGTSTVFSGGSTERFVCTQRIFKLCARKQYSGV